MDSLNNLLEKNKNWAETMKQSEPDFFEKLAGLQTPEFLWIGCSDSRITPAASIGLLPGEMFVHRNIANLVVHTDMNCLSVIQFAVDVLKVKHIIVCGHYGCGGVRAVIEQREVGLVSNWLRHLVDIREKFLPLLDTLNNDDERARRLCELNVTEQVRNVCQSTIIQNAWRQKQALTIHGWVYGLKDGLLRDLLRAPVTNADESLLL
jgi:carbonic anhydrase